MQLIKPSTVEVTTRGMAKVQIIFLVVFIPCAKDDIVPPNMHMEAKQMDVGINEDDSQPVDS